MKNRILTLIAMPLIAVVIAICGYFFIKSTNDKLEPTKPQIQTVEVKKEEQSKDKNKKKEKNITNKKKTESKTITTKKHTNKNSTSKHTCDFCGNKVSTVYSTECDGNLCKNCYDSMYGRHKIVCEICGTEADDVEWHGDYRLCQSCYEDILYSDEGDESLYHRYDEPDYNNYNENDNIENIYE